MKRYNTFLFDLDDTLLDFKASERLSFKSTLEGLGVHEPIEDLFKFYQVENDKLWLDLEKGLIEKDVLKVKRFELLFSQFKIDLDPSLASDNYLNSLPDSVALMADAVEILQWLKEYGEIGIITNGIEYVQHRRIANSPLKDLISFVCVSESCGFAKPDVRFFEYTAKHAKAFSKDTTLVIGDRYDADIVGAKNFGVDSCWFNHRGQVRTEKFHTYEIKMLNELRKIVV